MTFSIRSLFVKLLPCALTAVCVAVLMIPQKPAEGAAMKIAYINVGEVIDNHPRMKDVTRLVNQFRHDKIDEVRKKFGDTDEKVDLNSAEGRRLVDETEKAMKEVDDYRAGLIKDLVKDIRKSAESLGQESGVEIIIASDVVLWGGLDLTPAMQLEMKKLNP